MVVSVLQSWDLSHILQNMEAQRQRRAREPSSTGRRSSSGAEEGGWGGGRRPGASLTRLPRPQHEPQSATATQGAASVTNRCAASPPEGAGGRRESWVLRGAPRAPNLVRRASAGPAPPQAYRELNPRIDKYKG